MSEHLVQGIVRILDSNGDTAGTGFVVSKSGLIATCSHVIQDEALQDRGQPRPERVAIVFHATGDEQDARVEPEWWLPWNDGDLAIIRLEGVLPQSVQPLLLGSAEGTNGHDVSTFGFPDVGDIEGLGADGRVVRLLLNAGRSVLQLRSSEITSGFSGAPIWDKLGRRVIGMVSAITEPDRHHRLTETAFAISTETLRNVCPALQLSEVCPYRGLAAFTEADTEFFFGRQHIVDGLLNRLRGDPRFLTVLGPSGSGKSSVVRAGLIPHLRSGKVPGSDHWGTIVTRPAAQPFDELSKQGLVNGSHDLTEHVRVWLSQHTEQERLVLLIDQFEELLSISPEAIRQDFITQLVKLLLSPLPISVVLVTRDDFYSRLTQQEALVEWLERNRGPLHVPRLLKEDELIAIVQKPAEAVGLRYEEGLVETIVKDSIETATESEDGGQAGRSAVLPLLEFALTELWKRRRDGMLTHEAYRRIGGVAGALTQWADRAFYALKPGEGQLAQRIFTDLVYVGDETQGILDSRRRRILSSLCRKETEQESVQAVVQHLVENRLLATDRDLQSGEETVEIIHDVLLREWGQLKQWLEEDRRFLTWHQELERIVHAWTAQRDRSKLLRGHDLTKARRWLKERGTDLSQDEIVFLNASARRRVSFVFGMLALFLLIVSLMGTAGWFYFHQAPDPTRVSILQDSNQPGSLRYAVDDAPQNSTITFAAGLHGTILLTSGDLDIGKNLTIRGPGAGILSISSGNNGFIVNVLSGITVTISGLTFKDTKTSFGYIVNSGTLTVSNCVISNNAGSIVNNGGTLTVNSCIISRNSEPRQQVYGGGIFNNNILTVSNSIISCNIGTNDGGIVTSGKATVSYSTISGNARANGGGIYINGSGTVTVNNSTISGNRAAGLGGGIYIESIVSPSATVNLTNTTISGNEAGGLGGGIFIRSNIFPLGTYISHVNLTFSTIYGNIAPRGGDIAIQDITSAQGESQVTKQISQVRISNSIVAADPAHSGVDMVGMLTSNGYNLFENTSGATYNPATRTLHATDKTESEKDMAAVFASPSVLRYNDGPTETIALAPDSVAVDQIPLDACHINGITTDQRGKKRPDENESACDIGAYEYVALA